MKVLFELPLRVENHNESQFNWLKTNNNNCSWLFVIENGRILRTISVDDENPGVELHSATLTEPKTCTSLSWNKDFNKLALIVDKRLVYIWDTSTNNFSHFKPKHKIEDFHYLQNNNLSGSSKKRKIKDIDMVVWSKVTERFLLCYSSAHLLICDYNDELFEKIIDNSNGVLEEIVYIEACEHLDLFVCISIISELLVMTFNGESKYYVQSDGLGLMSAKFSFPLLSIYYDNNNNEQGLDMLNSNDNNLNSNNYEHSIWLCYQTKRDRILFKRIMFDKFRFTETSTKPDILYINKHEQEQQIVDYYWLSNDKLIICFSSGNISLLQTNCSNNNNNQQIFIYGYEEEFIFLFDDKQKPTSPVGNNNNNNKLNSLDSITNEHGSREQFKMFKLIKNSSQKVDDLANEKSYSLAMISDTKLFYYELFEQQQQVNIMNFNDDYNIEYREKFSVEKVDDLDLTDSLKKINLKLEKISWSEDSSMMAVQLTNGHILIYRTKLQHYMLASYGPNTAYLSGTKEITILNYANTFQQQDDINSISNNNNNNSINDEDISHVSTLNVNFKPSLIAIGPEHLAVALNNRVQFYLLTRIRGDNKQARIDNNNRQQEEVALIDEQEYVSIVMEISLNANYVAVLFKDGRLKLHSIYSRLLKAKIHLLEEEDEGQEDDADDDNERYFPDPTVPETITSFILKDNMFIYCTNDFYIKIFDLKSWTICQTFNHSAQFDRPIIGLRSNENGNKYLCLLKQTKLLEGSNNVYLYYLNKNKVYEFGKRLDEIEEYSKVLNSQMYVNNPNEAKFFIPIENDSTFVSPSTSASLIRRKKSAQKRKINLNRISNGIWDSDGRCLLLIERKFIHVVTILENTLTSEEPLLLYAAEVCKPSSYATLYVSHGIVSYQTSLGRVINSILTSHDEESKLMELERNIQVLIENRTSLSHNINDENLVVETNKTSSSSSKINSFSIDRLELDTLQLKLNYLDSILPLYSLSKCKDICEHILGENQFKFKPSKGDNVDIIDSDYTRQCKSFDQVLWRKLSVWALFTMNLKFALFIYRKYGPVTSACVLNDILNEMRKRGLDAKLSIKTRLMILLNCDF